MALAVVLASTGCPSACHVSSSRLAARPGLRLPLVLRRVLSITPNMAVRKASVPRRVTTAAMAEAAAPPTSPSSAETARTIIELVGSGTISTLDSTGAPLGTYVTYVLDKEGSPIIRLRADAAHTENLSSNPNCSLFVHAPLQPVRSVARVTLIGKIEEISAEEREDAQARHAVANSHAIGIDAPQDSDLFMRLNIDRAFYVGGLGTDSLAEDLDLSALAAAEIDTLADCAPDLVAFMNRERAVDILRIAGDNIEGGDIDSVERAELMWIDKLGVNIYAVVKGQERVLRVNFTHEALDERDARSCLTMMAQLAWENERDYQPAPVPSEK